MAHLGATKKIIIQGAEVKKQEGYINDPTGYIKIVFWGKHTGEQQEGQTYCFNKIRVRENYGQKYLNTPKEDEECNSEISESFQDTLCKEQDVSTTEDITALILGINNLAKFSICASGQKKVTIKGKVASWNNCKMSQKASLCPVHWSFRLFVQQDGKPEVKLSLNVFKQQVVKKIFSLNNLTDDTSEDQLIESLLEVDVVKITYDAQSKQVIDIESVNI